MPTTRLTLAWLILGMFGAYAPSVYAAYPSLSTSHESIPDFCAAATIQSKQDGAWSNPATWDIGRIPSASDIVRIKSGTTVSFADTTKVDCLGVAGQLKFNPSQSSKLTVGTVIVYDTGYLEIGTSSTPALSVELVIADKSLNSVDDPKQFGTGLIVLGKFTAFGASKDPTFLRLASEPKAGDTTIQLSASASSWKVGDRLILPASNQERDADFPPPNGTYRAVIHRWDEATIKSISGDGKTVTLNQSLRYDHPGARDLAGHLDFLPHVGNLSRSVVIRSQTLSEAGKSEYCVDGKKWTDTVNCAVRGHTMFTYRADINVQTTGFRDLGRTTFNALDSTTFDSKGAVTHVGNNQIGRYPTHFHHLFGPTTTPANGYQYTFKGNAIDGGTAAHKFKAGITIHDTSYGLVQDNIVYNMGGAGVWTEDGSESFNVIDHNFVVRTEGSGTRQTVTDATEGSNFYFRGPNNYVRNNVGANAVEGGDVESSYFMKYNFYYLGNVNIPNFKGADTTKAGQYTMRNGNDMAILENTSNEGYASLQGLTDWWVCITSSGSGGPCTANLDVPSHKSVIKDMKLWHFTRTTYFGYPQNNFGFDGLIVRGDPAAIINNPYEFGGTMFSSDYISTNWFIKNSNIQGINNLIVPYIAMGTTTIEDSTLGLKNGIQNRVAELPGNGGGCGHGPRTQVYKNLTFLQFPGNPLATIKMQGGTPLAGDLLANDKTFVCGFNGNPNDNFQLFYTEQNANYTLPADGQVNLACTCDAKAVNNQVCWDTKQKAYGGEIAPCTTIRDAATGLSGYVCNSSDAQTICGAPGLPTPVPSPTPTSTPTPAVEITPTPALTPTPTLVITPTPTLVPNIPPSISFNTGDSTITVSPGDTLTLVVTAEDPDSKSTLLDILNLAELLPGAVFQ